MLRWCLFLCWTPLLWAQGDEIRALMRNSQAAWNRGDIVAYASDYEDSPETTMVGKDVTQGGPAAIAERYRKHYPSREAMGTLSYSDLVVRVLSPDLVLAYGRWELKRTAAGGGDASGRFTLLIRKTDKGWKFIYDHSA